jgi:hypothetical protein
MEQTIANLPNFEAPLPPWEQKASRALRSGKRFAIRDYIATLDPEVDCQEIVYLLSCYEFPWDTTRSLEFALFRVFGITRTSALLVETGAFVQRTQKRYDDTVLILSEIMEQGYDSPRGHAALVRMNKQHGRFKIPNEEFLYTLTTFIYEPVRWNDRYGYRKLSEHEKMASFHFWREVGKRMGIRDIPESYALFEQFNIDHEKAHFGYAKDNELVAIATRNLMISWFLPSWLRGLGAPFVHALIDAPLLKAVGMPAAPGWLQAMVKSSLKLRGRLIRFLLPRKRARLLTRIHNRTYPDGYVISELGAV